MKISKSADKLLKDAFTRNGQRIGSAVDTSQGTLPLWGQLALAGLVINRGRGCLGHPFSIELTQAGKDYLDGQ